MTLDDRNSRMIACAKFYYHQIVKFRYALLTSKADTEQPVVVLVPRLRMSFSVQTKQSTNKQTDLGVQPTRK